MTYSIVKKILFSLPPEVAHHLTLNSLNIANNLHLLRKKSNAPKHSIKLLGLEFPNRVGLAAGLDKNGEYIDALSKLGFGFIEVGTITPKPQSGNPKPRIFRIPPSQALINRLGFNNKGIDYLVNQLKKTKYQGILGINIGKNKDTPNDKAIDDYIFCLKNVHQYASYITINISSPNTQGLRELQQQQYLEPLLNALIQKEKELAKKNDKSVPLLIKIAPDILPEDIPMICRAIENTGIAGLIATNTTIDHTLLSQENHIEQAGGLSGAPLFNKATKILAAFREELDKSIPIIGVGGINSADDAIKKLQAGANLVQIYTGLIYQGPKLIIDVIKAIQQYYVSQQNQT